MTEEEFMITSILRCSRAEALLKKKHLNPEQQRVFLEMKRRRDNGEPLQYVVGEAPFMDFELEVNPHVLIPRPETELLVDALIKKIPSMSCMKDSSCSILDIGTGSGCIAIALKRAFPNVDVTAWDVSKKALVVAQQNARRLNVSVCFQRQDVLKAVSHKKYDIIVSNPPYIKEGDLLHLPQDVQQEPKRALNGGTDGLFFYKQIIPFSYKSLTKDGLLAFEMGDGQSSEIHNMLLANGFGSIQFIEDYVRTPRHVFATINRIY